MNATVIPCTHDDIEDIISQPESVNRNDFARRGRHREVSRSFPPGYESSTRRAFIPRDIHLGPFTWIDDGKKNRTIRINMYAVPPKDKPTP
jgi:hypothetical protein